jgi:hypothetical protein
MLLDCSFFIMIEYADKKKIELIWIIKTYFNNNTLYWKKYQLK